MENRDNSDRVRDRHRVAGAPAGGPVKLAAYDAELRWSQRAGMKAAQRKDAQSSNWRFPNCSRLANSLNLSGNSL
jgi:hypothetical protein